MYACSEGDFTHVLLVALTLMLAYIIYFKCFFFRFEITETARVFGYILFTMSTSRYDLPLIIL